MLSSNISDKLPELFSFLLFPGSWFLLHPIVDNGNGKEWPALNSVSQFIFKHLLSYTSQRLFHKCLKLNWVQVKRKRIPILVCVRNWRSQSYLTVPYGYFLQGPILLGIQRILLLQVQRKRIISPPPSSRVPKGTRPRLSPRPSYLSQIGLVISSYSLLLYHQSLWVNTKHSLSFGSRKDRYQEWVPSGSCPSYLPLRVYWGSKGPVGKSNAGRYE